ncbi:MAG TPA: acyltransferase family protein, partial [Ilumatobacteraceae bacterium]|nr:acyltransferase family protein [Ilumatobacteraceae bacterium]
MDTVLAAVLVGALVAVWWMIKPGLSRNDDGRDPWPRSSFASTPEVPPPALRTGGPTTLFRPEIEGLRAIAVLLVLVYHGEFAALPGGFIGVDVFFVVSGYLITSLLLRELSSTGTVSLSDFWARRARRLLPASGLVIVATLLAGRIMLDGLSQQVLARDAAAASAFVANFRFLNVGSDYLTSDLPDSPLLHFWSLAVEEQFYLLWPGLLLLMVRYARLSRRALAAVLAVGGIASFVVCGWATSDQDWNMWAFFMLPARAWELIAGALLAITGVALARWRGTARAMLGWVGLGVVIGSAAQFRTDMAFPGWIAAIPVLGTVAVLLGGGVDTPSGPRVLLDTRPLQWIGARSYAIYLWHFPLLVFAAREWGETGQVNDLPVATRLGLLALSVVLAAASYRLVENPVRHAPSLISNPARSLAMGAWIALIGLGSSALLLNNPPALSTDVVAAAPTLPADATSTTAPPSSASTTTTASSDVSTPGTTTTTTLPPVTVADASHDNPEALSMLIAANLPQLEAGVSTSKVPANMRPSLSDAAGDLPQIYDNRCILDLGQSEPKSCIYGDANGSTTIVLFGDSHAAQWMPALHKVASENGWRLIIHAKKACPSAEIPTEKDPQGTDCIPWREAVIEQIEQLHPYLARPRHDNRISFSVASMNGARYSVAVAVRWLLSRYISTSPTMTGQCESVHIQSLVGTKSASYRSATSRSTARRSGRTAPSREFMHDGTLDRLPARQGGTQSSGVAVSPSSSRWSVSGRTF